MDSPHDFNAAAMAIRDAGFAVLVPTPGLRARLYAVKQSGAALLPSLHGAADAGSAAIHAAWDAPNVMTMDELLGLATSTPRGDRVTLLLRRGACRRHIGAVNRDRTTRFTPTSNPPILRQHSAPQEPEEEAGGAGGLFGDDDDW